MIDDPEVLEAIRAFWDDPEGPDELRLPGYDSLRMRRVSDVHIEVDGGVGREKGAWEMTLFKATDARPDGFPRELPFLKRQPSVLFLGEEAQSAVWPEAPPEALEDLVEQSRRAGWEPKGSETAIGRSWRGQKLQRGREERFIAAAGVGVHVVDQLGRRADPEPA